MLRRIVGLFALCAILVLASQEARAERRVALVIGNGAYQHTTRLPNPTNDARDVAAALKRVGFDTIVGLDLGRQKMEDATIRFARAARSADVALFYYSGHAMQFNGVNYLMPVDASLTDEADLRRLTRVDAVVSDLQQAKNLRILVLDACRDNPLAEQLKRSIGRTRAASIGRGLAKIDSPRGMIVAYATQAGQVAADGSGSNSPFTTAFLKHIETSEEIGRIFRRITADVYEATKRTQLPELSLSLIGEFYLKQPAAAAPRQPKVTPPAAPKVAVVPPPTQVVPNVADNSWINDLANRVSDSIVNIVTKKDAPTAGAVGGSDKAPRAAAPTPLADFSRAADAKQITGKASGFIIDGNGLIVTTNHAIAGAETISVTFKDGTVLNAKVIGRDAKTDLALLKVQPHKSLPSIRLGNSDELTVGRPVVAIGNSLGLGWTIAGGMVSALHRDINAGPYDDYIQTDIGATKGFAGAPLLSRNGEVVGIMAALMTTRDGRSARIAFAIPSNMAAQVISQLHQFGRTERGWLGVRIQGLTKAIAGSLGVPALGALVAGVNDNSPARAGGVKQGDVIIKFNGKDIKQMRDLPRVVAETPVGKEVEIVFLRKGKEDRRKVKLGRLEDGQKRMAARTKKDDQTGRKSTVKLTLGLELSKMSDELRRRFKIRDNIDGLVITGVGADVARVTAGKRLAVGEVIVEAQYKPVATAAVLQARIDKLKKDGKPTAILLVSTPGGDHRFVALSLQ